MLFVKLAFRGWLDNDAMTSITCQYIDDGAAGLTVAIVTLLDQVAQCLSHGRQVSHLLLDQSQLAHSKSPSLTAGTRGIKGQQCTDLFQRETQCLRPLDESQAFGLRGSIAPMPSQWLGWLIQQAAPLVVARIVSMLTPAASASLPMVSSVAITFPLTLYLSTGFRVTLGQTSSRKTTWHDSLKKVR